MGSGRSQFKILWHEVTPELVKEAQGLCGELTWLSTRTRPDLAFAVARMSQWVTKAPTCKVRRWDHQLQLMCPGASLSIRLQYPKRGSSLATPW